jgi:hypothetical protein
MAAFLLSTNVGDKDASVAATVAGGDPTANIEITVLSTVTKEQAVLALDRARRFLLQNAYPPAEA